MTDLDKLLERAVLHIKHGTSGMCVAPQEIVSLIEELRLLRETKYGSPENMVLSTDQHEESLRRMFNWGQEMAMESMKRVAEKAIADMNKGEK